MAIKNVNAWLDEYGESHQNPVNKTIHWICVPLIALSLVGVLWDLPVPGAFEDISPAMNWGMLFLMAAIVYYFILSPRLAVGMVLIFLVTSRGVDLFPSQRLFMALACVATAGLCAWIIHWE